MERYRRSKLAVVVIIGMVILFRQAAQANTTLLSGSFNAAEAERHLGSFTFQAQVDGQLLINMDNPDGSADGEIVFTNVTTGLCYNDGLFYGTTDYPLLNPQTWPRVRITQGRVHSLYVLPVLADWGSCDYDVSYVSRLGTQNTGTNSITITYIPRPLTPAGANLFVSLTSERFESNSASATFDAGEGGMLLLDLLQNGTGGGYHSVYLNGRGIEYNQVGHPPRVMGVHTAIEVGAGTHNLMIRYEDDAWGDNTGVRRTDVYFIPYPFETYYVDADAGGSNDGSSWADAYKHLQNALAVARYGDEIRIAQGLYTPEEPPPDIRQASNPNPADGARSINIMADLSWTAGSSATSHDVYFGMTSPPPFVCNQTATTFDPGTMDYYTTYFWRIDEVNKWGKTTGIVWSFKTTGPGPSSSSPPVVDSNEQAAPKVIDREATFQLINGVLIKGGYAGFSEPDPNDRNIDDYETILSGDIGVTGYSSDNSIHVVTGSDCDSTAVLDGFKIIGGNANGVVGDYYNRCGAGMFNAGGSPTVINCTFSGNSAAQDGGGLYNRQNSSPTVTNCKFIGNSAKYGGGMYHRWDSNSTVTNCIFSGNFAEMYGGGVFNWCASSPSLRNCTFSDNTAPAGNALACNSNQQQYPSIVRIVNCILWDGGNEIVNVDNSVILATYSDVQGGYYGTGNINENPLFVDPAVGDYYLMPDSPCINAGEPDYPLDANETDLDGKPRVIAGRIDMGAYEFNHMPVANAGPDQTIEAQDPRGAKVTLNGSGSSDVDSTPGTNDDIDDFDWYELDPCDPNVDVLIGSGQIVDCNLPIGEHIIILEVIDKAGASDTNEVTVIVQDTTPPVFTNDPQDLTVECNDSHNLDQLNAWLASATAVDECGDVTITNDFVGLLNSCGATGAVTVIWTAEDESGNTTTTPPATFTIVDTTPPVITCPPDVTLECPADTSVEANGSGTAGDTCGNVTITHSDQWQPSCGNTGTLTRTWTATDECSNSSSCVQMLTVVDTTPPEFEFSVAPTMLWPPDHKMVLITPSWTVSDECDPTPDVSLIGIVANEGDDAIGDGHTSNDIQIGEDGSIYLRSERSGTGNDRLYTITYRAVDDCGNAAVRSANVSIPHDFKVLARIASRWLWTNRAGRIPEDLNGDGVVNLKDIAIFADNWIK